MKHSPGRVSVHTPTPGSSPCRRVSHNLGGALRTSLPRLLFLQVTFVVYTRMGYPLTPDVAFTALSLFGLLRFPVSVLPRQIMQIVNAHVALKRIQGFMDLEEVGSSLPPPPPSVPADTVSLVYARRSVRVKASAGKTPLFFYSPHALLHSVVPRGIFRRWFRSLCSCDTLLCAHVCMIGLQDA